MSGSGVDPGATVEGKERVLESQSLQRTNTTHIYNLERWMHGHLSGYQIKRKCTTARIHYGVTVKCLPWSHILKRLVVEYSFILYNNISL